MAIPLLKKPNIGTVRSPASGTSRSTTAPGPTGNQFPATGRFTAPGGGMARPNSGAPPIGFGGDGDAPTPTPRPNPTTTPRPIGGPAPGSAPGPMPPTGGMTMEQWRQKMIAAGAPYLPGSEQLELEARDPNAAYLRGQEMSAFRRNNLDLWRARPGFTPGQGAVPNVNPAAEYSPEEAKYGQRTQGVEKFIRAWEADPNVWAGAPQEVLALRDKIMAGPLPSLNKGRSGLANTPGNQWVVNPAWMKANWGNAEANRFDDSRYWKDGGTGAARELTEGGRAMTAHRNSRNSAFEQWNPTARGGTTAGTRSTGATNPPAGAAGGAGGGGMAAKAGSGKYPDFIEQQLQSGRQLTEAQIQEQIARRDTARRGSEGGPPPLSGQQQGMLAFQDKNKAPNARQPGYIWNGREWAYDPTADPNSEMSQAIAANPTATWGDVNRAFPEFMQDDPRLRGPSTYGTPGQGAAIRLAPGSTAGPPPPSASATASAAQPATAPSSPPPSTAPPANAGPAGGFWFQLPNGQWALSSSSTFMDQAGNVTGGSAAPGSESFLSMLDQATPQDLQALMGLLGSLFGG